MSPLGKRLLTVCNSKLEVDMDLWFPQFTYQQKRQAITIAIWLGLTVIGGS